MAVSQLEHLQMVVNKLYEEALANAKIDRTPNYPWVPGYNLILFANLTPSQTVNRSGDSPSPITVTL